MPSNVQIVSGSDFTRIEIRPERKRSSIIYLAISTILGSLFVLLLAIVGIGMYHALHIFIILLLSVLCLLAILLLTYSWLWYLKGKEVLILGNGKILHFKDFRFFKIGKNQFPYKKAEVLFKKPKDTFNKDKNLMDDIMVHKGEAQIGIRLESGKMISVDLSISIDDARRITKYIV